MHIYRNFIGGEWRKSESEHTVSNINPAHSDEVLGLMPQSTRA